MQLAADFARKHPPTPWIPHSAKGATYLIDQVTLKGEDFKFSKRQVQGKDFPVIALHRTFALDAVRNRVYRSLQSFPPDTRYQAGDEGNLLYHYLTSDRAPEGRWLESPGTPDHWFHADSFCEAIVLAHQFQPKPRRFSFGSVDEL